MVTNRKVLSLFLGLISVSVFVAAQDTNISLKRTNQVVCFTEESVSITTPEKNCGVNCREQEKNEPLQTLSLTISKNFKKKGAFLSEPAVQCFGRGCKWAEIGAARIEGSEKAIGSYRSWGPPAEIILTAKVCLLDL